MQVQFIRTAGLYAKMRSETPRKPDPLLAFQKKLMASLSISDDSTALTLRYTIFVMLAKVPDSKLA